MMQMSTKPTYHVEFRFGDNPIWDMPNWAITADIEQAIDLACHYLKRLIREYLDVTRSAHVRVIEQHGMKRLVVFQASRERD